MSYTFIKYIHYLGIFLTVGGVFAQLWMVKKSMTRSELKTVGKVDGLYGLGAIATVAAGLILWLTDAGKSSAFYTAHGLVYLKLAIFSLVGLLSIYPTMFLARQKLSKKQPNGVEQVMVPQSVLWVIRLEFALLLLMPYLAALMAQGLPLW